MSRQGARSLFGLLAGRKQGFDLVAFFVQDAAADVLAALGKKTENDDPAEALSALSAMTGTEIPAPLARVLTLPVRFTGSVSPDRMENAIFS